MSNAKKYDSETNEQLSRAQALEAMLGSSGWKFAEQDLQELVAELRDTRSVPREGDVAKNLDIRDGIATALEEWVDSLKGQVNNATIVTDTTKSSSLVERR